MKWLYHKPISHSRVPRPPSRKARLIGKSPFRNSGVGLLWILFFGTVMYVGCFSPFLRVSVRIIDASSEVSPETVERFLVERLSGSYGNIFPRNNYFFIQPRRLALLLEREYPVLRDVAISKIFPDRLEVSFRERSPIVVWCSAGPCYLLDESGQALDSARAYEGGYVKDVLTFVDQSGKSVLTGERIMDPSRRDALVALWEGCEMIDDGVALRELAFSSRLADEVRGTTVEGWEIYFSTEHSAEISLNALQLILDKKLSGSNRQSLAYVDLRVENRAYYAFRDGEGNIITESESDSTDAVSLPDQPEIEKKKKKKK